jgi:hypothetical protein
MVLRAVGTLPSLRRVLFLLLPSPAEVLAMRDALTIFECVSGNRIRAAAAPGGSSLARRPVAASPVNGSASRGSVSRATVPPPGRGR